MQSRKTKRRKIRVILLLLLVCFICIQFIRPPLNNPPVTGDITVPAHIKEILNKACYDCHSNQTAFKWFDQIAPAYWLVADHVKKGRAVLNFSEWDKLAPADQKGKLWESVNQVIAGAMPLQEYVLLHGDAKLSATEITALKQYIGSLAPSTLADSGRITAGNQQYDTWVSDIRQSIKVQPTLNGIEFMPDYKNWTAISTTDRFDNGTMRVIFGNDIAVKAIREQHINPWPDGTIFAKVAWDQLTDMAGKTIPGAFKQVEFMIKDHKKYATTDGWGWARWKGMQLTPYGKSALFTTECTGCHKPMRDNDFVFTTPLHLSTK